MNQIKSLKNSLQLRLSASNRRLLFNKRVRSVLFWLIVTALLLSASNLYPPKTFPTSVDWMVQDQKFSIPAWEEHAIISVAREWQQKPAQGLPMTTEHDLVITYLHRAGEIGRLEQQMSDIRVKIPDATEAASATASLLEKVQHLRQQQDTSRLQIEAIIEGQVSSVIADWRLGLLSRALPPVLFRFEEPPYYLVISPRSHIQLVKGVYLQPGLPLSEREQIEKGVEKRFPGMSALVTDIGGFSTWPTMVINRAALSWILSTVAHEWTHTYLAFYPLGQHYFSSNDLQAMNETVADIVGNEVGGEALRRYYPELVPPTPTPTPTPRPGVTPTPPPFNFNREMRITRITVDKLLAAGKIDTAETYMEKRRRLFVKHGYYIRKLNQAYFAFHGNYRAAPEGPSTPQKDPIGTRMRELRRQSPDLRIFLCRVRGLKSLDDLKKAVGQ